jgi:hypothetical protein
MSKSRYNGPVTLRWSYLVVALLLAAGCGSETGLIFKITADEGALEGVDELTTSVGLNIEEYPTYFVDDSDEPTTVDVSGRNLASDPYRLLIRPGDLQGRAMENVKVMAMAVAFSNGQEVASALLDSPLSFTDGEVREYELKLVPGGGATVDEDCVRGGGYKIGSGDDQDCDGELDSESGGTDCNDLDPSVSPNKPERCDNGIDDNCNGKIDAADDQDDDGDGYIVCDTDPSMRDCFENADRLDLSARIHPGADEVCNGFDDNCSGSCDEGFDLDSDGVTKCGTFILEGQCEGEGEPDCLDSPDDPLSAAVYPGAAEVCDGRDNNCNGICDEHSGDGSPSWDVDDDKYTTCASKIIEVDAGGQCTEEQADCRDGDPNSYPGANEVCDGFDNNCNNVNTEEVACFTPAAEVCFSGLADCVEDGLGGDHALGACVEAERYPAAYCESHGYCLQDVEEHDPYACAEENVDITEVQCKLNYTGDDANPTLCPNPSVQVFTAGAIDCSWQVHESSAGIEFAVDSGCDSTLSVTALEEADQTHSSTVWRFDPDEVFKVVVEPQYVDVCPDALGSLICSDVANTTWPPSQ